MAEAQGGPGKPSPCVWGGLGALLETRTSPLARAWERKRLRKPEQAAQPLRRASRKEAAKRKLVWPFSAPPPTPHPAHLGVSNLSSTDLRRSHPFPPCASDGCFPAAVKSDSHCMKNRGGSTPGLPTGHRGPLSTSQLHHNAKYDWASHTGSLGP